MSMILVRATVNIQGLRCGEVATVDDSIPYIAHALATQALVPLPVPPKKKEGDDE